MQIHQILVRPRENTVVILYDDAVGSRHSVIVDSSGNATVSALVAFCEQRLPADNSDPAKARIQQEIAELESRLTDLRNAIGAT